MLKRTVHISSPSYLKMKNNQLVVTDGGTKELKGTVPIEDIAIVVMDHPQISISAPLINELMHNNCVLLHCSEKHLPNGMMLPLEGHSEMTERWRYQLEATLPLKKQLWKQTVYAKIKNQKNLLDVYNLASEPMVKYGDSITSGDETNMEGKAANHYWKYIFTDFRRNPEGDNPNNFLNYGYAILRAIVARALVCSGMLPAQGIFHRNKYNPYCLADDIMEPYRPYVDALVMELMEVYPEKEELDRESKVFLLKIATQDVSIDGSIRPLFVAVTTTTSSLYKCFTGERRTILYPEI